MGTALPDPVGRPVTEGLEIRLLGGVQVRVGGEAIDSLRSGRARSLLAALVLDPDVAQPRHRLAAAFWPDSPEAQARTNLRNVLHTLRQAHPAIDAALSVTPTTLQWRPVEPVAVDVDRFVAAADAALASDPDDPDDVLERCRAAVDLYRGPLLDGDDDEWLQHRRTALRDRHRAVLRLLVTALIDAGRPAEATAPARALLDEDPFDESAHRLRMEAHHAAGDRAGAVRAFHECVASLERELGVAPAPETAAFYDSLVGVRPAEDAVPHLRPVGYGPGMVGRDDEWQALVTAWAAARAGSPSVVLVTGEPGIGKTRLTDELRRWCSDGGAAVADARSYVTDVDLGYAVVASWLRSPDIRAGVARLPAALRAELHRLLPELGPPVVVDGLPDAERRRLLFDAVVAALTATGRPTLLVADDAQWSDRASQEVIHCLARQPVDVPLLVVMTARDDDLDPVNALTALRDELVVLDRLVELRLERLPLQATGALGCQLVGGPLDDRAVETLFAESEGNPLFVVETVRAGWNGSGSNAPLSPRLRAVIEARLRRLSDTSATVARMAAVVGRPCSAALLGDLTGLDDRSLAQALDELWRRGVLRETGSNAYDFSHGKLREVLYDGLSPALQRSYHRAVAEAFADLVSREPALSSSHVAGHFQAAHRMEEAVAWLQRAALEAQQMYAYDEAVQLLERALAHVPSLPTDIRHVRELELLATLPLALAGVDGFGTNRMSAAQRRAAAVAADLGVELDPAFVRSTVMSSLCRDEFAAAAEAAQHLLEHATATNDPSLHVESHYLLGISAFWSARTEDARVHFETVVRAFDPSTRAAHVALFGHDPALVCQSRLANTLWFLGRDDEARSVCRNVWDVIDTVDHPFSRDTVCVFTTLLAVDLGDRDLLQEATTRFQDVRSEALPFVLKREAMQGLLDVLDGRCDDGLRRIDAALDRCEGRNFFPGFQATIARVLVAASAAAGDAARGVAACATALAIGGTPLWEAEIRRVRAESLHRTGAPSSDVEEELRVAATVARHQRARGLERRVEETRTRLAVAVSPGRS